MKYRHIICFVISNHSKFIFYTQLRKCLHYWSPEPSVFDVRTLAAANILFVYLRFDLESQAVSFVFELPSILVFEPDVNGYLQGINTFQKGKTWESETASLRHHHWAMSANKLSTDNRNKRLILQDVSRNASISSLHMLGSILSGSSSILRHTCREL